MILYWIQKFFAFVRWLLVKPADAAVARVNPNAKCPACGARNGKLETVVVGAFNTEKNVSPAKVQVQHTCNVCNAVWAEAPILKVDSTKVQAVKRAAA